MLTSSEARKSELAEFEFEMATADLVSDILDEIHRALEVEAKRVGMTKSGLAERMGRDKSEVTKMLRGNRNLTLQSVARVIRALDHYPVLKLKPLYTAFGDNDPTWHEVNRVVQATPEVETGNSGYLRVGQAVTVEAEANTDAKGSRLTKYVRASNG